MRSKALIVLLVIAIVAVTSFCSSVFVANKEILDANLLSKEVKDMGFFYIV